MRLRKRLSQGGLLYIILDSEVIEKNNLDIFSLADDFARAGADMLQFRLKNADDADVLATARVLANITHKHKKFFVVNDRADIALCSGADGVHLGANDVDVKCARNLLGKEKIIGRTIHALTEIEKESQSTCDYFGVGPVFRTPIKKDLKPLGIKSLQKIISRTRKPCFCIGGINQDNLSALLEAGIKNIALCRSVLLDKKRIVAIRRIKQCLQKIS